MDSFSTAMARDFGAIADLIRLHAQQRPASLALRDGKSTLTYGDLDALMDRVAATCSKPA
jgi:long-chain acyl-CoA synthetase